MAHTLPPLPYAFNALEPHIDARTMEIHHGKHHQAYVTNLNAALDKHPELHQKSIEDLLRGISSVPDDIRQAVINNGGGKIFSRVASLRALPDAARNVIENRHELSFEPWAQLWGMEYLQTDDVMDLEDLLPMPIVIEIRPDPLETEAFWKNWQRPVIRPR